MEEKEKAENQEPEANGPGENEAVQSNSNTVPIDVEMVDDIKIETNAEIKQETNSQTKQNLEVIEVNDTEDEFVQSV